MWQGPVREAARPGADQSPHMRGGRIRWRQKWLEAKVMVQGVHEMESWVDLLGGKSVLVMVELTTSLPRTEPFCSLRY